ncbi:MAG: hypothetical protein ABI181_09435 [Mycobacteriaceae bacterium]
MNTPVPGPPADGVDPAEIRAVVDAALAANVEGAGADELARHVASLDELHRALSAALDTIDRV